jgi:hypothetical protein
MPLEVIIKKMVQVQDSTVIQVAYRVQQEIMHRMFLPFIQMDFYHKSIPK